MSNQNWRTEVDAQDYFGHQQKQLQIADRRPVIRKGSDLVGPGIGANTVRITDFNDVLATFDGYYSATAGAVSAPNETDSFIGTTVSDAVLGGVQEFTSLQTGIEYRRTFVRGSVDPEAVLWGKWTRDLRVPATAQTGGEVDTTALNNTPTLLVPPYLSLSGPSGVYERTSDSILLREPGVYTGSIQIGDRVAATVLSTLSVYMPAGPTTVGWSQLGVPVGPTLHVPFTVTATDAGQGFQVVGVQQSGVARDLWWRFSCTRVGDVA